MAERWDLLATMLPTVVMAGVPSGIVYRPLGVGMALTLRASGTVNLAHGYLLMVAVYVAVATSGSVGLIPVVVTVAVATAGSLLAYLTVYAPAASGRKPAITGIGFLPALAVALLARSVAQWLAPAGSTPVGRLLPGPDLRLPGGATTPAATW